MISNPLKDKSIDSMVLSVQNGNRDVQNKLLQIYQPFIAKCVSEVCKRYINPLEDDEFSVGLFGFNEAMLHYSLEKGSSFFSFANVVIKRKVIDYIRAIQRVPKTVSLDELYDNGKFSTQYEFSVAKQVYYDQVDLFNLQEEIQDYCNKLATYKLTLQELMIVAPKHKDARASSVRVARILFEHISLKAFVQRRKMLPIKELLSYVNVSKKTLERNRKFILATFIILNEDYLYLQEYLKNIGE